MTGSAGRFAAVGISLLALALPAAAPAAAPNRYSLKIFQSVTPPGAKSVMLGLGDETGSAVGQVLLAGGRSHPLLFDGRRILDQAGLLGDDSYYTSMDALGYRAGVTKVNGVDHPFVVAGARRVVGSRPGRALWIASGGLVAVDAPGADGRQHALLWRVTDGTVRDLGPGLISAVNGAGVAVGRTLTGNAVWWSADGQAHDLGFPGRLLRVNAFNRASGYEIAGGGPKPIVIDLPGPGRTRLPLPRGWPYGSAKVLTDSGVVAGIAVQSPQGGLPSEGVVWPTSRRVLEPRAILGRPLPAGHVLADISAMTAGGTLAGSILRPRTGARAAQRRAAEMGYVAVPYTSFKLEGLTTTLRRYARTLAAGSAARVSLDGVVRRLGIITDALKRGRTRDGCRRVDALAHDLLEHAQYMKYHGAPDEIGIYNQITAGIWEWVREDGCRRFDPTIDPPPPLLWVSNGVAIPMTQERFPTEPELFNRPPGGFCACRRVKVYLSHLAIRQVGSRRFPGDSTRLDMRVNVKVDCDDGQWGCTAGVRIRPPAGATFLGQADPVDVFFWCNGDCGRGATVRKDLSWVALVKRGTRTFPNPKFTPGGRANRTIGVTYETYCTTSALADSRTTGEFGIRFDRIGQVDFANSDLDDDNFLDGGRLTDANGFD